MIDLAFSKRNGALIRKQFVNRADEKTIDYKKREEMKAGKEWRGDSRNRERVK